MKCGFYETNVTPSLGSIIPGGFAARYADEVLDPLFARAFVAVTEEKSLAIVSIDACGITQDITDRIRERVAKFAPDLADGVMVMATHAHGAGPTLNWGEEVVTDPHYLTELVNKASDAIVIARSKAEEADLLLGSGEIHGISFIRVYKMQDGSFKTNPGFKAAEEGLIGEPYTTIDPELIVLGVRVGEKMVGAVVNFATHPATVATRQITGDYISALAAALKETYGPDFVTVFINGACGNINHLDPFDRESNAEGRYRLVGRTIAEKVAEVLAAAPLMKNESLRTATERITVSFRKPSPEALLEAKEVFAELGDNLIDSVPRSKGYKKTFFALQAFRIMADKRTQREMELQLFAIGDLFVAGTPTQIFTEFGKAIKEGCKAPTMVSAFANDYCGYVPAPQFIGEKGVYEAQLCPTSALEKAAGDKVVKGILSLREKI